MRKLFVLILLSSSMNVFAESDVRLISVTGVAEKSFQPDIVRINLNLWGKGDSAKKAQSFNQAQYDVLKKSIETYKVKKEDVKTVSYNLNPEYVFDQKTNRNNISGYSATQDIVVTLRKVDDAGPFIDSLSNNSKAMTSGVSVTSLGFDIEKRADEERALLSDAVRSAEAQAQVLAKAANVKIKGVYRLSPRSNNGPMPMFASDMREMRAKSSAPTAFMTGEVKVVGEISAEYIIE